MAEDQPQGVDPPRRRILTSHSRQQLEAKVFEMMLQGWVRIGDIAVAKSVIDAEPPYLTQAMIQIRKEAEEQAEVQSPETKTIHRRKD